MEDQSKIAWKMEHRGRNECRLKKENKKEILLASFSFVDKVNE